jgi:hypothetical protein
MSTFLIVMGVLFCIVLVIAAIHGLIAAWERWKLLLSHTNSNANRLDSLNNYVNRQTDRLSQIDDQLGRIWTSIAEHHEKESV